MTAGAHSHQPSLRSAFAPSDSGGLRLLPVGFSAAVSAATCVLRTHRPLPSLVASGPPALLWLAVTGAHGTSPFACRASLIWLVILCAVFDGLMPDGGEIRCEMSMDTTW